MNALTVVQAKEIIEGKQAKLVVCQRAAHDAKNKMAMFEASLNHMIESGELDIDLAVAISEEAGALKEVFANIQLELSMGVVTMELIRTDFIVKNKQEVFTNQELEFIDASVNGLKHKTDIKVKASVIKKLGAKSLPHAIALAFKLGIVKLLCAVLMIANMGFDYQPVRASTARVMRMREGA